MAFVGNNACCFLFYDWVLSDFLFNFKLSSLSFMPKTSFGQNDGK